MDELFSLLANAVLHGEEPAGYLWNEEGTEVYITLDAPQAEKLRAALREWAIGWKAP